MFFLSPQQMLGFNLIDKQYRKLSTALNSTTKPCRQLMLYSRGNCLHFELWTLTSETSIFITCELQK